MYDSHPKLQLHWCATLLLAAWLPFAVGCSSHDTDEPRSSSSDEWVVKKIPKPKTDRMLIEVDGKVAGYATTIEQVKTSRPPFKGLRMQVGVNMTSSLSEWLEHAFGGDKTSHDGSVYLGGGQRLDFKKAHFDAIELPLVDSGLGNPSYFTLTFAPKAAKLHAVDDAADAKAAASATELGQIQTFTNAFQLEIGGTVLTGIRTSAALRRPTKHYGAWEVSELKVDHSSAGYDQLKDYVTKILADGALEDQEYEGSTTYLDPKTGQPVLHAKYASLVPQTADPTTGVTFQVGKLHVSEDSGQDAGSK